MKNLNLAELRTHNLLRAEQIIKEEKVTEFKHTENVAKELTELVFTILKLPKGKAVNEIANVIIYLDMIANHYNADLSEIIVETFNKQSEKYDLNSYLYLSETI